LCIDGSGADKVKSVDTRDVSGQDKKTCCNYLHVPMNLEEKDKRFLWHPFTQMTDWEADEVLVIERGEGPYLFDTQGRRYLDGVSSLWVNLHGHRHPDLDRAVREQLDRIAHSTLLGLANTPSIELAEQLVRIAPENLTRVFYSDNGSTAVEVALKMAFTYWQQKENGAGTRTRILAYANAYHGDTLGSVSVGGIDLFHSRYRPLLFETLRADYPYCYRCPLGLSYPDCRMKCLESTERLLSEKSGSVGAVIIEPRVQGAGGIIVAPEGFLRGVRDLCRKYRTLLIADEVAVGFGRTGTMFACQAEGVSPDFLCLAKGITGGYLPLAATLTTDEVYRAFLGRHEQFRTFFHGHSYTGNPLACAAALANIEIFEKERVIEGLPAKVEALKKGLAPFADLPVVGDIRQAGLIAGVELVQDTNAREPIRPEMIFGNRVCRLARNRGILIRPLGDVLVIMPPLCCTEKQIHQICEGTLESLKEAMTVVAWRG